MMKTWKLIATFLILSSSLLLHSGCTGSAKEKAELEEKITELIAVLQRTELERDTLRTQAVRLQESLKKADTELDNATQARDILQQQLDKLTISRINLKNKVDELAISRDELQTQVNELAVSRDNLQNRIEELTQARDAALVDAKNAQEKIDNLTAQLQSQVTQINDLHSQITAIKSIIGQLQRKLK